MSELPVRPDDLRALAGLFSPQIVGDPYPVYARWREERPVARPRERLYVLSRFADCEAVLGDPAFGRAEEDDARLAPGRGGGGARGGGGRGQRAVDAADEPAGPHPAAPARLPGLHPGAGAGARTPRRSADRFAARRCRSRPRRPVRPDRAAPPAPSLRR